jgi:hypothetical protein
MATLNFEESIVLILFAQAFDADPTQADVIGFDAQLQSELGEDLHRIMSEEEVPIDVHSRSLVLGLRPHMPGSTQKAIREACRYVLRARQELGAAPVMGVVAAAPASRAPAATGARKSAARRRQPPSRATRSARRSRRGSRG